jgi:hypothetical protein
MRRAPDFPTCGVTVRAAKSAPRSHLRTCFFMMFCYAACVGSIFALADTLIRCNGGGVVSLSLPVQRARVRARVTSESDSRDILILSGGSSAAAVVSALFVDRMYAPGGKQKFRLLQKAGAAINDAVNLGFLQWHSVQDVHAAFWPFTEFLNEISQITIRAVNRAKFHPRDF